MGEFDKPNAASVEATGPHTELSRGLHELGLAGIVDFVEPLIRAGLMRDSCGATNGASTRTVRRSLKDSDMPPPGEWVSFSRCAHALRFAERQRVSLNTAAMMTGWHDASVCHEPAGDSLGNAQAASRVEIRSLCSDACSTSRGSSADTSALLRNWLVMRSSHLID